MWLFDKRAFTSTVAYDPAKDMKDTEHKKVALASADPKAWLLVRARAKEDLEAMEATLRGIVYAGDDAFSIYIAKDGTADYAFRALVSRPDMKAYLIAQVDEIDYGSHFKEVVQAHASQPALRHTAMMAVWSAMNRLTPYTPTPYHAPYLGGGSSGGSNWWNDAGRWSPTPKLYVPEAAAGRFGVAEMAVALLASQVGEVDPDTINGATDDAFEMWLQADLIYGADQQMTAAQVDELLDWLNDQTVDAPV